MTIQQAPPAGKYKLTIDDFLRLDETGVFGTTRTELLDGDIIIMDAEYRPHGWIKDQLQYRLRRALEELRSELFPLGASVALPDHSMPLPDIVLTSEPRGGGPIPYASVALLIEVAASTWHRDTGEKVRIYAQAGIPEYWIVEVDSQTIRRMWEPSGATYFRQDEVAFGEPIAAATIPHLVIATDDL